MVLMRKGPVLMGRGLVVERYAGEFGRYRMVWMTYIVLSEKRAVSSCLFTMDRTTERTHCWEVA